MHPDPLINGLNVNLYGVMIAVGLLACFGVLFLFGRKKGLDGGFLDFIFYDAVVAIVLGFLSASLFQAFYNYLENPEDGFRIGSGITFIGGLIGGVITFIAVFFIFKKYAKGKLFDVVVIAPCCILIAHAFGRLGCLFAGCCHGEYLGSSPVAGGIYMRPASGIAGYYVPTQLYEALFLFFLFGVCTLLYFSKKGYNFTMPVYLIGYGIFRFIIEIFRDDNRGQLVGSISPSQFWSILMVVIGVALIFIIIYREQITALIKKIFNFKAKGEKK